MTAHIPIMVAPILEGLRAAEIKNAHWVDGTVGAGGHSHALLSARPDSLLLGLDLDPHALELAATRLSEFGERAVLRHSSYENLRQEVEAWVTPPLVDGILLDLGISSMQVDSAERGFSFRFDGLLDMRFNPHDPRPTAADLVNTLSAEELADILYTYGEEKHSRRIASTIVRARPITTTHQLAELVASQYRGPREKIHPATRTFQALRIAVNDELGAVERVLPAAVDLLKSEGRLAVITFHSLEDRIVKQFFKEAATDCICPPRQPVCTCGHRASIVLITRKPITADEAEITMNPRARSAKLRIVEKL